MMYIEIESTDVQTEISRNNNELRNQFMYMWEVGHKYPTRYKIGLGTAPAFAVGKYLLGAASFRVSRFGQLELDLYNIQLHKLNDAQLKALCNFFNAVSSNSP